MCPSTRIHRQVASAERDSMIACSTQTFIIAVCPGGRLGAGLASCYAVYNSFVPRLSETGSATLPHIAASSAVPMFAAGPGALEAGGRRAYSPDARGKTGPDHCRVAPLTVGTYEVPIMSLSTGRFLR